MGEQNPITSDLPPITPEQAALLKQLTDGKKIAGTVAKPLWIAVVMLAGLIFGAGQFWSTYQVNTTEGSPAFKKLVEQLAEKDRRMAAEQSERDKIQTAINTKLTTIIEQHERRIQIQENRR